MTHIVLSELGTLPYGQGLALQHDLRRRLLEETNPALAGYVLVLEHTPTVTLGKRGQWLHLKDPGNLREQGIEVFRVDRGGEATYHGPGQLVIYPILRLDAFPFGVSDLVRGLAAALTRSLQEFQIETAYDPEHPGVWTTRLPRKKIASVGMRVSGGVTTHGMAVNVTNDMRPFSMIVPCGMPDSPLMRLSELEPELTVSTLTARLLQQLFSFLDKRVVEHRIDLPQEANWIQPEPEM
jgi:lipoyl(octanoyl) transferase